MTIKYCGPFTDPTGYGEANRNILLSLISAGIDVVTQPIKFTTTDFEDCKATRLANEHSKKIEPYKVKILHVTPDVYPLYIEQGKYHIGHLFWETDRLPSSWVKACNMMDEIWTGSKTTEEAIRVSGVTVPVKVFPQPVNVVMPAVKPYPLPNFQGFVFYSVIDWKERKNPRKLLEAYWREFKGEQNVTMLIKTGSGDYTAAQSQQILEEARIWKNAMGFKDTPRTMLYTKRLDIEGMHRFHETGTCFVSAHRGEGWGLPQVEALLHNNPVISTAYGGVHDWMKGRHYKPVSYRLVPITQTFNKYYEEGMHWAEADEASLRERMRYMFDTYNSPKKKQLIHVSSSVGRNFVRTEFNYQLVGGMMAKRLEEIENTLH